MFVKIVEDNMTSIYEAPIIRYQCTENGLTVFLCNQDNKIKKELSVAKGMVYIMNDNGKTIDMTETGVKEEEK